MAISTQIPQVLLATVARIILRSFPVHDTVWTRPFGAACGTVLWVLEWPFGVATLIVGLAVLVAAAAKPGSSASAICSKPVPASPAPTPNAAFPGPAQPQLADAADCWAAGLLSALPDRRPHRGASAAWCWAWR